MTLPIEEVDPFTWRLPKEAVPHMRVDGMVFGSKELVRKALEDRAVEQVANVAALPGITTASARPGSRSR